MSHNTFLPLSVQKAVLGRLLVYKALDLHRAQIEAADYGLLWNELHDRLDASTARQLRFIKNRQPLQDYLRELARELRRELNLPDSAREVITPLLDSIDELMDEAAQARNDLLVDAFQHTMNLAWNEYNRYGIQVPQELVKHATVTFDHQENKLNHTLPIQLTACTLLDAEEPPPSASVRVILVPGFLDEETAFAFPYVLLHECLCHVFQGPWACRRVQPDADSRWAEGWMDVVAYQLHAGLDSAVTESSILMTPLRRGAHMLAAERVHYARHEHHDDDRAWSHRAIGCEAANLMLDRLGRLPESQDHPAGSFMRLSLTVNASPRGNNKRDLFATLVNKHLRRRWSDPGSLVPLARQYLRDGDALRLFDQVLKLP